ncbi:MAG TPA: alpha/beta hydrolase [Roseiflexaceae bacterium]|nr:alpha/beta hydrolase [Roseiflexaceae bacterium]
MSAIYLDNRLVHYEFVGRRGQPTLFLHSWMGSWRYWLPTMDHISEKFRAYAMDFWGFGDSDRSRETFTIDDYVRMTIQFMDTLGLSKVNLVGHGMGGMVAVRAANEQPERFGKLMIVSTPIFGSRIQEHAKSNTFSRLLGLSRPTNDWAKLIRQMPAEDEQIRDELVEDTENLSEDLLRSVIHSVAETDLNQDLRRLDLPLLAVYGGKDSIVSSDHASALSEDHKQLQQVLPLPNANHFPFLEQPVTFNRLIRDFLDSDGSAVEMKTIWRRRVSQLEYI